MNSEEIKSIQAYARYAFGLDEAPEVKAPEDEPANESTRLAIVGLNIFESQRRTLEAALRDTELESDARGNILNHAIERAEAAGIHTGNSWYQAIDGMANTITALQSRVRELERLYTNQKTDLYDLVMLEGTTDAGEQAQRREILQRYE